MLPELFHKKERLTYSTPETPNVKQCATCGENFTLPRTRPGKKYCSDACRAKAYHSPYWYTCKQCGNEYRAKKKDRDQFCSRQCAHAAMPGEWPCLVCGQLITGKGNLIAGQYCSQECRRQTWQRKCKICGKGFESQALHANICSDECRKEDKCRRQRKLDEVEFNRTARPPRRCKNCGKMFTPKYGNKHRIHCSIKCSTQWGRRHKEKSLNSRARKILRLSYGEVWQEHYESINRRKVFQRDGWRCQLCGCKVKATKNYHPQQAIVDHIVPLSFGGDHKYVNVQAACMLCNSRKSASIEGQLRLFG